MAKIIVEYDTVEKTVTVKQDGKELPNVNYVSITKAYSTDGYKTDDMCMCMGYGEDDEENGMKMSYSLMASSFPEGQEQLKKGRPLHKDLKDFVVCSAESDVRKSIVDFLSN